MKQKILSITVTLLWFALVGVWYVYSATHFWHELYLFRPMPLADTIVGWIWVTVPPLLWWIPRRLLIRSGKWHRIGTIVFCIGSILCSALLVLRVALFEYVPNFNQTFVGIISNSLVVFFIWIDTAYMLFMELLFLGFKKEPTQQ